jgi:NADH-quinone oxidoreductase subunit J
MGLSQIVYYFFAGLAVAGGILMITRKNPVHSAMYLVLTLFSLAAIFVLLEAHFLAALQVLVYAGAILVLFLFVIMLLNLGHEFTPDLRGRFWWVVAIGVGSILFAELVVVFRGAPTTSVDVVGPLLEVEGAVAAVARPLFTDYVLAVEVTGVLLLVAMVGAVVLAKRDA